MYIFVCACVCACVHVCHMCAGPMRAKRRYQILLEVGVTDGCKLPKTVPGTSSLNTVDKDKVSIFFP